MLSDAQKTIIRRCGVATMHDYRVVSLSSGEPFLEESALWYYDGRTLTICAQPLRDRPAAEDRALRDRVRRWISDCRVDSILYVGSSPLSFPHLEACGYIRQSVRARIPRSAELFLPVHANRCPPRLRRMIRRATLNGFSARHRRGGVIDARHLILTEQFYRKLPLTEYLAELVISLPAVMTSRDTTLLEAWEGETMRGFVTVHEPFDAVSVATFIAHDGSPGVSDFLYAQLLDHALRAGSEFINVGPSPSSGHYRFKLKWCGVPLVPPYYAALWRRGNAKGTRWLLRILGRNS